jgi:hypothetical protein
MPERQATTDTNVRRKSSLLYTELFWTRNSVVLQVDTNATEEYIASIFRVEKSRSRNQKVATQFRTNN